MAHGILSNTHYASTQREWHGLGALMAADQPIEVWQEKSGLNYKIQKAFIRYPVARLNEGSLATELRTLEDKVVLFREDTGAPLGVVSEGYKIVQPRAVLEFFRDWADARGLTIESAGALFGGKRYFATAKITGAVTEALDGAAGKDVVKPYVLLSTSADGSLATEASWKVTRVVCNNTLGMARAEGNANYRVTHRSVFKADEAKGVIEAANAEFSAFMETARMLAGVKVTSKQAEDLYVKLLLSPTKDEDKVRESAAFQKMLALFNGEGKGSMLETARETAWGWLQSTTEYADHYARARSEENRFAAAMWGPADNMKDKAFALIQTA